MPSGAPADEIDVDVNAGDFAQTAKDLFAGAAGGVAQVLIGQPFDIVKVRLQTTTQYKSALDCATQIYKKEGPGAFYKGTLTPLVGVGACVSVQFGAFHFARRFFESRNAASSTSSISTSLTTAPPLTYTQYYLSGAFAGLTNTVLSTPIEHVRIRLQTQPHTPRLYSGPLDCMRKLIAHGGGLSNGLYRGSAVTVLRECQGYGVWFMTYEFLMQQDVARRGLGSRKEVEAWRLALYGGLAGEALWLASYPLDVVKSRMQTDGLLRAGGAEGIAGAKGGAVMEALGTQKYTSMRDCFGQIWRQEGMGGFWKGIGPTLLRAMPVSAATFAVAEMTLRLIS